MFVLFQVDKQHSLMTKLADRIPLQRRLHVKGNEFVAWPFFLRTDEFLNYHIGWHPFNKDVKLGGSIGFRI